MPSRQVSRKALTCSGSRVMCSRLPSRTSRLVVDHWKLELNRNAVGRVDVDALHLALQPLPLGQGGHHLEAIAENHAVLPVAVVLVELGAVGALGYAVKVGEHIRGDARRTPGRFWTGAASLQPKP